MLRRLFDSGTRSLLRFVNTHFVLMHLFFRTLIVEDSLDDKADDQWVRNKSQTELWTLVQHANPQEIIPYSIALISKLNRVGPKVLLSSLRAQNNS